MIFKVPSNSNHSVVPLPAERAAVPAAPAQAPVLAAGRALPWLQLQVLPVPNVVAAAPGTPCPQRCADSGNKATQTGGAQGLSLIPWGTRQVCGRVQKQFEVFTFQPSNQS